eukprot:jgi/Botrbrau1/10352/Bobra.0321s0027.1
MGGSEVGCLATFVNVCGRHSPWGAGSSVAPLLLPIIYMCECEGLRGAAGFPREPQDPETSLFLILMVWCLGIAPAPSSPSPPPRG